MSHRGPLLLAFIVGLFGLGAVAAAAADDGHVGVLVAEGVDVTAEVGGRVVTVMEAAREGARVKKGAPLARLDPGATRFQADAARATIHRANADVARARAIADSAEQELARLQELFDKGFLSREALETGRLKLASARATGQAMLAKVTEERSRLAAVATGLASAVIRAPFDGVVAARYVSPGALVQPNALLFRIVDPESWRVRFALPAAVARTLRTGTKLRICGAGMAGELAAVVSAVSPEVDPSSWLVFVEGDVRDSSGQQRARRSGEQVTVFLAGNSDEGTASGRSPTTP
jgi:RND family efflux transporter MFP subunit